jgi:hypothetical protein
MVPETMAAAEAAPVAAPVREGRKPSPLREENRVLKTQIERLADAIEGALRILGRGLGEKCPNCLGEIPIPHCFRCSRVARLLDALKLVGR